MIRKAEKKDISRIAEILVFDKRMNYRSIFKNDDYSFHVLQVLDVAKEYAQPEILDHIFVYDDGIVKGLISSGTDGNRRVLCWIIFSESGNRRGADGVRQAGAPGRPSVGA